MATVQHSNLTGVNAIHVPYAGQYATAAARETASDVSAADEGKLFRQLDDNSLWMLISVSPLTWKEVGFKPQIATTTVAGLARISTASEADTGIAMDCFITPYQLKKAINDKIGTGEQFTITTSQDWIAPFSGTVLFFVIGGGGGGGGSGYSQAGYGQSGGTGGTGGITSAFSISGSGGAGGAGSAAGSGSLGAGGIGAAGYGENSYGMGGNGAAGGKGSAGGGGGKAGAVTQGSAQVRQGTSYPIIIGGGGGGGSAGTGVYPNGAGKGGYAGLSGAVIITYI